MKTNNHLAPKKMYNTTVDTDLILKFKILAAQLDKRQNDLLEEAIGDLLNKYNNRDTEAPLRRSR
jgi:hypothetical protein